MGLDASRLLAAVLGLANGGNLIMVAFAGTGAVFRHGIAVEHHQARFVTMGKWLFIGAVMIFVAMIANFFIQSSALMLTLMVLAIGVFLAFILV